MTHLNWVQGVLCVNLYRCIGLHPAWFLVYNLICFVFKGNFSCRIRRFFFFVLEVWDLVSSSSTVKILFGRRAPQEMSKEYSIYSRRLDELKVYWCRKIGNRASENFEICSWRRYERLFQLFGSCWSHYCWLERFVTTLETYSYFWFAESNGWFGFTRNSLNCIQVHFPSHSRFELEFGLMLNSKLINFASLFSDFSHWDLVFPYCTQLQIIRNLI